MVSSLFHSSGIFTKRRFGLVIGFHLLFCLVLPGSHALAVTGDLSFDPPAGVEAAGYKVYYGTQSRNYPHCIDIGNQTRCEIAGLEPERIYYFAATVYDANGIESDFSTEMVTNTPPEASPGDGGIVDDPATGENSADDSDGDGLTDYEEVHVYGTDPARADSDGDGMSDYDEIHVHATDPNHAATGGDDTATVYEDAEDGAVNGWMAYGTDPAGASVANVYDEARQSRVIQLDGAGTDNGYRLGDEASATWASKWGNTSQFVLEWSMQYSESFVVFIDTMTSEGQRYLLYTPVDHDNLGAGQNVHHGIGSAAVNGEWTTVRRDLRADLAEAQPGVTLLEVNAFLIRGSGRIDDIKLGNGSGGETGSSPDAGAVTATVYEDAEDGTANGWMAYGVDPAAASVANVFDEARRSRVIQFNGAGTDNGYRLADEASATWASKWAHTAGFVVEWSMQYSESFVIFIDTMTSEGQRYLLYTPVDYDNLGTGQNIHHGLGAAAANGEWATFKRDLRADLQEAQPGATILEVNAFLIRGSGRIDDIKLSDETLVP